MKTHHPDWGGGEEYFGPRHRYREKLILKNVPSTEERSWLLDVACGLGTLSEKLMRKGHRVLGMDMDLGAALQTRRRGVPVVLGDAGSLPLRDNRIETVVSAETLEHISMEQNAASEFRRVITPGGSLVISVPAHESQRSTWDEWAGHLRRYNLNDLTTLFQPFLPVQITGFGFPFLRLYDRVILRRVTEMRHREGEESSLASRWFILKKLFGGVLFLMFHLQIPSNRWNVGWVAHFILTDRQ